MEPGDVVELLNKLLEMKYSEVAEHLDKAEYKDIYVSGVPLSKVIEAIAKLKQLEETVGLPNPSEDKYTLANVENILHALNSDFVKTLEESGVKVLGYLKTAATAYALNFAFNAPPDAISTLAENQLLKGLEYNGVPVSEALAAIAKLKTAVGNALALVGEAPEHRLDKFNEAANKIVEKIEKARFQNALNTSRALAKLSRDSGTINALERAGVNASKYLESLAAVIAIKAAFGEVSPDELSEAASDSVMKEIYYNNVPVSDIVKAVAELKKMGSEASKLLETGAGPEELFKTAKSFMNAAGQFTMLDELGFNASEYLKSIASMLLAQAYKQLLGVTGEKKTVSFENSSQLQEKISEVEEALKSYSDVITWANMADVFTKTVENLKALYDEIARFESVISKINIELESESPDFEKIRRIIDENRDILSKYVEDLEEFSKKIASAEAAQQELSEYLKKLEELGVRGVNRDNVNEFAKVIDALASGDLGKAVEASKNEKLSNVYIGDRRLLDYVSELHRSIVTLNNSGVTGVSIDNLGKVIAVMELLESGKYMDALRYSESGENAELRDVKINGLELPKYLDAVIAYQDAVAKIRDVVAMFNEVSKGNVIEPHDLDKMISVLKGVSSDDALRNKIYLLAKHAINEDAERSATDLLNLFNFIEGSDFPALLRTYVFINIPNRGGHLEDIKEFVEVLGKHRYLDPEIVSRIKEMKSFNNIDDAIAYAKIVISSLGLSREDSEQIALAIIHQFALPLWQRGEMEKAYEVVKRVSEQVYGGGRVQVLRNTMDELIGADKKLKEMQDRVGKAIVEYAYYSEAQGLTPAYDFLTKSKHDALSSELEKLIGTYKGKGYDDIAQSFFVLKSVLDVSWIGNRGIHYASTGIRRMNDALARMGENLSSTADELASVTSESIREAVDSINKLSAMNVAGDAAIRLREDFLKTLDILIDLLNGYTLIAGYLKHLDNYRNAVNETSYNPGLTENMHKMFYATYALIQYVKNLKAYEKELRTKASSDIVMSRRLIGTIVPSNPRIDMAEQLRRIYHDTVNNLGSNFTELCQAHAAYCTVGDWVNEKSDVKIEFSKPSEAEAAIHRAVSTAITAAKGVNKLLGEWLGRIVAPLTGIGAGAIAFFGQIAKYIVNPQKFAEDTAAVLSALHKIVIGRGGEVLEEVRRYFEAIWRDITSSIDAALFYAGYIAGQLLTAVLIAKLVGAGIRRLGQTAFLAKHPTLLKSMEGYLVNLAQGDPLGLSLVFVSDMTSLVAKGGIRLFSALGKALPSPSEVKAAGRLLLAASLASIGKFKDFINALKRGILDKVASIKHFLNKSKNMAEVNNVAARMDDVIAYYKLKASLKAAGEYEVRRPEIAISIERAIMPIAELRTKVEIPEVGAITKAAAAAEIKVAGAGLETEVAATKAKAVKPPEVEVEEVKPKAPVPEAPPVKGVVKGITVEVGKTLSEQLIARITPEDFADLEKLLAKYSASSTLSKMSLDLGEALNYIRKTADSLKTTKITIEQVSEAIENLQLTSEKLSKFIEAASADPSIPSRLIGMASELKSYADSLRVQLRNLNNALLSGAELGAITKQLSNIVDEVSVTLSKAADISVDFKKLALKAIEESEQFKIVKNFYKTFGVAVDESLVARLPKEEVDAICRNLIRRYADIADSRGFITIRDELQKIAGSTGDPLELVDRATIAILQKAPDALIANDLATAFRLDLNLSILDAAKKALGTDIYDVLRVSVDPVGAAEFLKSSTAKYLDIKVAYPAQLVSELTEFRNLLKAINHPGAAALDDAIKEIDVSKGLIKAETLNKIADVVAGISISKDFLKQAAKTLGALSDNILPEGLEAETLKRALAISAKYFDDIAEMAPEKGFGVFVVDVQKGKLFTNIKDPAVVEKISEMLSAPMWRTTVNIPGIGDVSVVRRLITDPKSGIRILDYTIQFPDGGVGRVWNVMATEPPSIWKRVVNSIQDLVDKLKKGREAPRHWEFYSFTGTYFDPVTSVQLISKYGSLDDAVSAITKSIPDISIAFKTAILPESIAPSLLKASLLAGLGFALTSIAYSSIIEGLKTSDVKAALSNYVPSLSGLRISLDSYLDSILEISKYLSEMKMPEEQKVWLATLLNNALAHYAVLSESEVRELNNLLKTIPSIYSIDLANVREILKNIGSMSIDDIKKRISNLTPIFHDVVERLALTIREAPRINELLSIILKLPDEELLKLLISIKLMPPEELAKILTPELMLNKEWVLNIEKQLKIIVFPEMLISVPLVVFKMAEALAMATALKALLDVAALTITTPPPPQPPVIVTVFPPPPPPPPGIPPTLIGYGEYLRGLIKGVQWEKLMIFA